MKHIKKVVKTVGAIGLVGWAVMSTQFAMAANADSGWVAGMNIGQSVANIDDIQIRSRLAAAGLTAPLWETEDNSTAFKIFAGYKFNKNFAIEGGYFDLGQFGISMVTVPAGTLKTNISLRGVNLDAVSILPFTEKLSGFGRVGLNYAEARDGFSSTGAVTVTVPVDANPSKRALNLKVGLGMQYALTESVGMRAEWERYRINDAVDSVGDINMYSIGLVVKFDGAKPAPVEKVLMPSPAVVFTPAPPAEIIVVTAPRKVVFSADSDANALFGFGKTNLKPTGERALDKFAAELKGAEYEVVTITGHTDRIGSSTSNMKLSTRRAEAVKSYLVSSAGIPANKISARGAGESNPLTRPEECKGNYATKNLVTCLAPDRRVEVEVTGIRPTN